jgi:hypothetical protein
MGVALDTNRTEAVTGTVPGSDALALVPRTSPRAATVLFFARFFS